MTDDKDTDDYDELRDQHDPDEHREAQQDLRLRLIEQGVLD